MGGAVHLTVPRLAEYLILTSPGGYDPTLLRSAKSGLRSHSSLLQGLHRRLKACPAPAGRTLPLRACQHGQDFADHDVFPAWKARLKGQSCRHRQFRLWGDWATRKFGPFCHSPGRVRVNWAGRSATLSLPPIPPVYARIGEHLIQVRKSFFPVRSVHVYERLEQTSLQRRGRHLDAGPRLQAGANHHGRAVPESIVPCPEIEVYPEHHGLGIDGRESARPLGYLEAKLLAELLVGRSERRLLDDRGDGRTGATTYGNTCQSSLSERTPRSSRTASTYSSAATRPWRERPRAGSAPCVSPATTRWRDRTTRCPDTRLLIRQASYRPRRSAAAGARRRRPNPAILDAAFHVQSGYRRRSGKVQGWARPRPAALDCAMPAGGGDGHCDGRHESIRPRSVLS